MLQQAADAQRLVFAVVGSGRYPGCIEVLDAIDKDPALAAPQPAKFMPVLADLELCPERASPLRCSARKSARRSLSLSS